MKFSNAGAAVPERMENFNKLHTFVTVARVASFSAVARLLGVSSSALSHSVSHLEARLGARLLNRTTRSVMLTEARRRLYDDIAP